MRAELKKINGVRQQFTGEFERFGTKANYHGYPEPTILLKNIKDATGKVLTDHLWFTVGKQFESLRIESVGTIIKFDARVKPYAKGYFDSKQLDFKLANPTNFAING